MRDVVEEHEPGPHGIPEVDDRQARRRLVEAIEKNPNVALPDSASPRLAAALGVTATAGAQVDPSGEWRTLATAHFRIHFRPAYRTVAERAAREAERAWGLLATAMRPPRGMVKRTRTSRTSYDRTPYVTDVRLADRPWPSRRHVAGHGATGRHPSHAWDY